MRTRNPDLGWVQAGRAVDLVIKRLAERRLGQAEQPQPPPSSCASRSVTAERGPIGCGDDRQQAGDGSAR